jgi:hypothetical protein
LSFSEADFQDIEPILLFLKRFHPQEELSIALMERMAIAPLPEFNALKALYFEHEHMAAHEESEFGSTSGRLPSPRERRSAVSCSTDCSGRTSLLAAPRLGRSARGVQDGVRLP